jgi:hypothetical protein
MDFFEKKYGTEEDERIRNFHSGRRMFCIFKNRLFIADQNLPYTHAVWFQKQGWITEKDDHLMDEIIRGMVDKDGNISFYLGYNMRVIEGIELIFKKYIIELSEKLNLKKEAKVLGGWEQYSDKFGTQEKYMER